ncbi:MAG TPA: DUF6428 family protein [Chthoniobacteraceae bacterium]|jgi:hypothetical protein|nr:hypothetical protein [Chthoniobacter sp.]HEV7869491.1 DUF6428 family protein [Chthoniobacteraceae bacterium]
MKLSDFKTHLETNPNAELRFILPDEDVIPAHAHITEAGRIDKSFIDCGGTVRQTSNCTLQAWVADDVEHRLAPGKLAGVLDLASPLFRSDDLEVEVEYEDCAISQFPVLAATAADGVLTFRLGSKHTDCLAKHLCLPPAAGGTGTGCC